MFEKITNSFHFIAANELIESAKGQELSSHEREKKAIELSAQILVLASKTETPAEERHSAQLARMMLDHDGKAFTTAMTDECFRSKNPHRIADQLIHLIDLFGLPHYLSAWHRFQLKLFRSYGKRFASLVVPLTIKALRDQTRAVILPGEERLFKKHLQRRKQEGVKLNINHLGEAILGEREAKARLSVYLEDLKNPEITYISIKISTIYSQINLIAYEETLSILAERLRELYRQAMRYPTIDEKGIPSYKFVNLDMEEYRDLFLTKDLFMRVLDEEEFLGYSAGIVLQAYLPDSYNYLKEITTWALKRKARGGAPVKIRIVKGANLAMEEVESSLHGWPRAPYATKLDTDSNFKAMLHEAIDPEKVRAVHIGVASHNIFDIAYTLILRAEKRLEKEVSFEMLEGMAEPMQRVVHQLAGGMLLYCAVARRQDFQSAIAYLIRRLDENTGADNFLRHSFGLKPDTPLWGWQTKFFSEGCSHIRTISHKPRRDQDRHGPAEEVPLTSAFENEPETDFALPQNRLFAQEILHTWHHKKIDPIPLVIGGEIDHREGHQKEGSDPSRPKKPLYHYAVADAVLTERCIATAKEFEKEMAALSVQKRCVILHACAHLLRKRRADFLGALVADGGKTLLEADVEFCEAIDFIEYYLRQMQRIDKTCDIRHRPRGTALITPPWNFPISIPTGGIVAAFAAGNAVIFKPAPEAVLCGWLLCQALWDGGIPRKALQFINGPDESIGSKLVRDPRIDLVVLTGATATAKHFLKMHPSMELIAETGGKNTLIITAMSDRDLAIKDLIRSAFGHSGQKCSACSLAILEAEIYDDPHFRKQLKDAVESLKVGSAWQPSSFITPLIRPPSPQLLRALTQLEPGESWLVEPEQDLQNPNLWSPGVKLGVSKGSFTHQTEFFGPLLGLMRARDLDEAIELANDTPYGLTAGIHSLDDREQRRWQSKIEAGNCYINRSITGAIVSRQPFGGTKASSFGPGRKAGGPNYLNSFLHLSQIGVPKETFPTNDWIDNLSGFLEKFSISAETLGIWTSSIGSYSYWWEQYRRPKDSSKLVGEDNFLYYMPYKNICVRIEPNETPLDYLRIFAAALTCKVPLQVSWTRTDAAFPPKANWGILLPYFDFYEESEEELIRRIHTHEVRRLRLIHKPSEALSQAAADEGCYLCPDPVLANGQFELLHYLKEVSLSLSYHRYGNLGTREHEHRKSSHKSSL